MQEKDTVTVATKHPETGDNLLLGEGVVKSLKQDSEGWEMKVEVSTTKTQAVLTLLAFVANTKGDGQVHGGKDAARALDVLYSNLEHFEIVPAEKKAGVTFHWRVKRGVKEAVAAAAIKEVLVLPVVRAAIQHIFKVELTPNPREIKKDGGPLKMSPYMAQMRLPQKDGATKTTYKMPLIRLTPSQAKFERAILRLLRDNSTLDKEHPEYLLGNGGGEGRKEVEVWDSQTKVQGVEQIPYARILVDWSDLYAAYTGKEAHLISGKERKTVRALLDSLKTELGETVWQREMQRGGQTVVQRFRLESPLIMQGGVGEFSPEEAALFDAGGEVPEDKERLLLLLHPAYTLDIKNKAHTLPADYDRRIATYLGKGGKMKAHHEQLILYLNSVRCGGARDTSIDLDTLVEKLELTKLRAKQGLPKVRAEIMEGLEIAKGVRLLLEWKTERGAKGQEQYQARFNPDFTK